ncbi:MAG: hypothetical protein ACFFDN_05260 [Candidatus Hodarchaeota archaeon]
MIESYETYNITDKRLKALIEDFEFKAYNWTSYIQWCALKQIEGYCINCDVEIPFPLTFTIRLHELAYNKQTGRNLEGWEKQLKLVTWKKNVNVEDGNCMFYNKIIKRK